MHFTAIRLENWRNFTSCNVQLRRRVFLVGPNASGKSNFLDAFRFLHDIASPVGGGFQEAVTTARRGGISKLRCLAARRYSDVSINVQVGDDTNATRWEYELQFNQNKQRIPIIRREFVKKDGHTILNRPDEGDKKDEARLTQTYLEQVNVNREFRELQEFLVTIRYLHLVPQLVREPDRYIGRRGDPFGSDFLEQIAKTPDKTQKARLRRIGEALKVAVPQLQELQFFRDEAKGTPHLRGKYVHWRPQGAWQTEEQFSDGTLRLLALLWIVLEGAGPLLLEEPELSLHPEVIRFLPQMFARMQRRTGRQVLISTHSFDILSDSGIGLDEVLLLQPGPEGTLVQEARRRTEIKHLLNAGLSIAEAVIPSTGPKDARQLSLFD